MAGRTPARRRVPALLLAVLLSLAPIFIGIWQGWTLIVAVLLAHRALFLLAVLVPASARRLTLRPLAPMAPPEWATDGLDLSAARRDVARASLLMMPLPDAQVFALGDRKSLEIYVSHGALASLDDQERAAMIERVLVGAPHREPARRARALVASRGLRALVLPVLPGGVGLVRLLDRVLVLNRSLWQAGVLPRAQETDLDQRAVREGVDARSLASALRVCASTRGVTTPSLQADSIDVVALARSPRIESDGMAFRRLGRALVLERAARLDALAGNRRHRHLDQSHELPPLPVEAAPEVAPDPREAVVVADELPTPPPDQPIAEGVVAIDAAELLEDAPPRRGLFGRGRRAAAGDDLPRAAEGATVYDGIPGAHGDGHSVIGLDDAAVMQDAAPQVIDDAPPAVDALPAMEDAPPAVDPVPAMEDSPGRSPRARRRARRRRRAEERDFPPLEGDPRMLPPPSGPPVHIEGGGDVADPVTSAPHDHPPVVDAVTPAEGAATAAMPGDDDLQVTTLDVAGLLSDEPAPRRRWWRRGRRRDADASGATTSDAERARAEIDEVFLAVEIPDTPDAEHGAVAASPGGIDLDPADDPLDDIAPVAPEPDNDARGIAESHDAPLSAPPPSDDVFARHIRTPLDDLADGATADGVAVAEDHVATQPEGEASGTIASPGDPAPPGRGLLARLRGRHRAPVRDEERPEIPLGIGLPPPVPVVVDPEAAAASGVIDAPSSPVVSAGDADVAGAEASRGDMSDVAPDEHEIDAATELRGDGRRARDEVGDAQAPVPGAVDGPPPVDLDHATEGDAPHDPRPTLEDLPPAPSAPEAADARIASPASEAPRSPGTPAAPFVAEAPASPVEDVPFVTEAPFVASIDEDPAPAHVPPHVPAMEPPPALDLPPAVDDAPPAIDDEAPPVIDPLPAVDGPRRIRYADPVPAPVAQDPDDDDEEFVAAFRDPLGERLRGLRLKSRRR